MKQYHDLLIDVRDNGELRQDRTGVGTRSVFGRQVRFDLRDGFPLLTTKNTHFKSIAIELLWFLRGDTYTWFLKNNGVSIWDEWADDSGHIGPCYGKQWRNWVTYEAHYDQIKNVIDSLRNSPHSRRHIVSAWNVADLSDMALPPCHMMFQFYVHEGTNGKPPRLSCHMYQRSADLFLGVPFNIASYALLTHMIAQVCGYGVQELVISFGDLHIYENHREQVETLLGREERPLPELQLNPAIMDIDSFKYEDIRLHSYDPHPAIKAPVAV